VVPEVSRFYGIVIRMFFNDHDPPHVHAVYEEYEALVGIDDLETIRGHMPQRAMALVIEWAVAHRDELRSCWREARAGRGIGRIDPLD